MNREEAVTAVVDALLKLSIPHMLGEPFASNFYGSGFATDHTELTIQTESEVTAGLAQCLGSQFWVRPPQAHLPPANVTRQVIEVGGAPYVVELFYLSDAPHDQEQFRRRRQVQALGRAMSVPTAEDVIVTNSRWFDQNSCPAERDIVRNVLAVQADRLDWDYIHRWCEQHGTRAVLDEIRASIPPI